MTRIKEAAGVHRFRDQHHGRGRGEEDAIRTTTTEDNGTNKETLSGTVAGTGNGRNKDYILTKLI